MNVTEPAIGGGFKPLRHGVDAAVVTLGDAREHPVVRAALVESGWVPGRMVDTASWESALRSDGYSVVAGAVEFLREFGGLDIRPPRRDSAAYGSGLIKVDPILAASGEATRIRVRENELGMRLTPVGEWTGEYILLMAEDGRVIAETTFSVTLVGRDVDAALRRMIVADSAPESLG